MKTRVCPKYFVRDCSLQISWLTVCQWRMLKNHWNTLIICLFGQTTKQPLRNFEPWRSWNLENKSSFEGWGLILVAYNKIVNQEYFLRSLDIIVKALIERVFIWDPNEILLRREKNSASISFNCGWNGMKFIFILIFWSTIFVLIK